MSYPTFYDPDLPALTEGARYHLTGPEGRHAVSVRRVRQGEAVEVVDGRGTRVRGAATEIGKNSLTLTVEKCQAESIPEVQLLLVQALGKGGRDESAIEAATEMGVDGVVAWESARCISQWRGEKERKGLERWRGVLASAMKQSRRSYLPKLFGFARGKQIAELLPEDAHVLVLHESATLPLTRVDLPTSGTIAVVVGPEGGLTEEEVALLTEREGASPVLLGEEVLRTSTAGPAAIAVLNARLGRW